jgi:hemolysin D
VTVARHLRAFGEAWTAETVRRQQPRRTWVETEFLPAALEVTETPPSPIGRAILWLIVVSAVTGLVWAFASKIDTVASAEGRLVPEGRLRSVEAAEQGVVRAILVREGEHVRAGQTLIELDPTIADADVRSARTELSTASLTRARDLALLAFAAGRPAVVAPPQGADIAAVEAERQLVTARIQAYEAKRSSLTEKRTGAEASARTAAAEIHKLEQVLPLVGQALDDQRMLERKGYGARQKLLQEEQTYVTTRQDLEVARARLDEAKAQVTSLDREIAQAREEFVGQAAQERAEAEGVVATKGDAVKKADERRSLQRLTSPVSGVVQEVSLTTIGEVPEVGKPLVTIVPDGEDLIVEALLLNRDAGFVHQGDRAVIKLEAYPFTRYGTLDGVVEHVSPDATVDQQRGLVFPVRIRLTRNGLKVDGRSAPVSPGMTATVEVVTGRRRVIDFLWSPVAKAAREAGHER